jgi:hypothetical protein
MIFSRRFCLSYKLIHHQCNYSPFNVWVHYSKNQTHYLDASNMNPYSGQTSNCIEIDDGRAYLWYHSRPESYCDVFAFKWPTSATMVYWDYNPRDSLTADIPFLYDESKSIFLVYTVFFSIVRLGKVLSHISTRPCNHAVLLSF